MTGKELKIVLFVCLLIGAQNLIGQGPTDLYLFQLDKTSSHKYHLYQPKWLSGFNPDGYTNQPSFTPSGDILVSVRKPGETQNDIYKLSLKTKNVKQFTKTDANEFSPKVHPDGQHISVIRQIEGEPIDQQLFKFLMTGGEYTSVIPNIKDIGYYTWLNKDELGLFRIEGEINRLYYHHLIDNKGRRITSSIGRSLQTDQNGTIIYVHKFAETYWYIKKFNPDSMLMDIVIETPGLNEDFTIGSDGTYFIGNKSKLYFFHPEHHTAWQEFADLSIYGIKQITRLAISPDGKQLALVSTKED